MTKRKTTSKQVPQAPTEAVESVKQETNTKVASKPKQANTTVKKASTGGRRGRPKKTVVKVEVPELTQEDKAERILRANVTITQVEPETLVEPTLSLYGRFVGWLFRITYNFRGY